MRQSITVNPSIHFGKPCIAGTRIPVHNILELVSDGISFKEIIRDYYPEIKIIDIKACIRSSTPLIPSSGLGTHMC